ncbi:hypothetical protein GIB67_022864 [Kingdonia uniflora]|uniref:HMG box domain-containing protein n=1 Tax=Kingdonia uniflora TaxID=39325 RepID=A0A7J7P779_9MAGN|nr:hypothetical protein GIB67_022864 [Kingdonia uniflora]
MPRLRILTILSAPKLKVLPALGRLELLEELYIDGIDSVKRIGPKISDDDVLDTSGSSSESKGEEIEAHGKKQEKLHLELKKLQKLKEFKPTVVKKENLDAEFKEVANKVGEKWRNLSAKEKKPYEEKYQAEREVYLQIVAK